jgi:hypothetical protein
VKLTTLLKDVGVRPDAHTFDHLINLHATSNEVDLAEKAFNSLESRKACI